MCAINIYEKSPSRYELNVLWRLVMAEKKPEEGRKFPPARNRVTSDDCKTVPSVLSDHVCQVIKYLTSGSFCVPKTFSGHNATNYLKIRTLSHKITPKEAKTEKQFSWYVQNTFHLTQTAMHSSGWDGKVLVKIFTDIAFDGVLRNQEPSHLKETVHLRKIRIFYLLLNRILA